MCSPGADVEQVGVCARVRGCGFPAAPAGRVARLVRSLSVSLRLIYCRVSWVFLPFSRREVHECVDPGEFSSIPPSWWNGGS